MYADIVIIGAGVVGLAVAAELVQKGKKCSIVVMERHERFGRETSSRNSEVIHAGIYYPEDSLKAALCVEGNRLLYQYARQWEIPHRRLGKLIVAYNDSGVGALLRLREQARRNGVAGLELLDEKQISRLEPHVRAQAALWSPTSGIIDSHRLMACLERQAIAAGALIAYQHTVTGLDYSGGGYRVYFTNPDGSTDNLACARVINCAGLQAEHIAALAGIDTAAVGYRIYMCKGEYFSLPGAKGKLVSRLIYPPPLDELEGLGVHLTLSLDGRARLGPNTIYVSQEDYSVDAVHARQFYHAAREFLPFLAPEDLEPEMAGIRPKLQGPGEPFRDFIIREESDRGLPGLVNLIGIESPGLTCCLSIARMVRRLGTVLDLN
ncbi:MAG TPA: NAD(P)/FAD-dependent oxidoreductase [Bacillota bacterium]|nr:NAD(P)/FAD-dependent oxidoreductase [Bacillota bacterium]